MAKMKMEIAQRAARHGLTAHVLYTASVEIRDAAQALDVIGDDTAAELRTLARRLDGRRRREMAGPPKRRDR